MPEILEQLTSNLMKLVFFSLGRALGLNNCIDMFVCLFVCVCVSVTYDSYSIIYSTIGEFSHTNKVTYGSFLIVYSIMGECSQISFKHTHLKATNNPY